jgi:outer membrane beta-barrel protein
MSRDLRAPVACWVALCLLGLGGAVSAQEGAPAEGAPAEGGEASGEEAAESPSARRAREEREAAERKAAEEEAARAEAPAEEAPVERAPEIAETDLSDEERLDVFWGGQRNVSIVQKRLFTKDKRSELSLFGGLIPNDPFRTYVPFGARFNYYFVESVSVELSGAYTGLEVGSGLQGLLRNKNNATVDLLDNQVWRSNVAVAWSPFYGKLSMFDSRLSHFDINLVGGGGVSWLVSPNEERTAEEGRIEPEALLGVGLRFFLTESFTMRLDFRQFIFSKVGGGTATPSEVTLGISFFLGG